MNSESATSITKFSGIICAVFAIFILLIVFGMICYAYSQKHTQKNKSSIVLQNVEEIIYHPTDGQRKILYLFETNGCRYIAEKLSNKSTQLFSVTHLDNCPCGQKRARSAEF